MNQWFRGETEGNQEIQKHQSLMSKAPERNHMKTLFPAMKKKQ